MYEHRNHLIPRFTSRYNIYKLVCFEQTSEILAAIAREKQIKTWVRSKKIALVETLNPEWRNLMNETLRVARGDR